MSLLWILVIAHVSVDTAFIICLSSGCLITSILYFLAVKDINLNQNQYLFASVCISCKYAVHCTHFGLLFCHFFALFVPADLRSYECFLDYSEGQCASPIPGQYRNSVCCCSLGYAYGTQGRCYECPLEGTGEYELFIVQPSNCWFSVVCTFIMPW